MIQETEQLCVIRNDKGEYLHAIYWETDGSKDYEYQGSFDLECLYRLDAQSFELAKTYNGIQVLVRVVEGAFLTEADFETIRKGREAYEANRWLYGFIGNIFGGSEPPKG